MKKSRTGAPFLGAEQSSIFWFTRLVLLDRTTKCSSQVFRSASLQGMLNAPEAEACSVEDVSDAELLHQVEDGDDGVTLSILLQVTRMAIVLDSEGYERKEIAEQLHLSADAVTKKIQRGMLYLRSVFSVVA